MGVLVTALESSVIPKRDFTGVELPEPERYTGKRLWCVDLLVKRIASSTCLSIITAVVILSFIAPKLSSQGGNPRTGNPSPARSGNAKVDELFAKWNRSDSPGCSLAISKNGALVYERGYWN